MKAKLAVWLLLGTLVPLSARPLKAQEEIPPRPDLAPLFDKQDVMVPMRDGVRLHAEIYTPKNAARPAPFLFERTPYGVRDDDKGFAFNFRLYPEMIPEGYIFVFQDIRGRFKSEGEFVMQRTPRDRKDPKSIDEGTDTYDTIDWLVKNVPNNNGRVGLLGISYGGWLTIISTLEPHPAMKAVSEQASPDDMFVGDDWHHNGAFRLSYGFEYVAAVESSKEVKPFKFDRYDTYEWYLSLGPLSNVNEKYFHGKLPTWNAFMEHTTFDDYWKRVKVSRYLDAPTVPNLNVAGWWDQEDFYGPIKIYETLEKKDSNHLNYLVVGPWNHGGWAFSNGRKLGIVDFGTDTAKYFREKVQAAWFAYWLKDEGPLPVKEALAFQTGTNEWKQYDEWPPHQGITPKNLYFQTNGRLAFETPQEDDEKGFDSYISDPAHPVPYRPRPILSWEGWTEWLVQDQRFVHMRPDVLSWETHTLKDNVTVTGDIMAHLAASTSGTDSDWIVKLIDAYPEEYQPNPKMGGYQLMIADEVFRAKFRNSFEKPEPLVANRVIDYNIDLHTNNHCFQKGHKIMVQVQSTWFPLIDRNPQKFIDIPKAKESDYQKATQRVYRSKSHASYVELPVAKQ